MNDLECTDFTKDEAEITGHGFRIRFRAQFTGRNKFIRRPLLLVSKQQLTAGGYTSDEHTHVPSTILVAARELAARKMREARDRERAERAHIAEARRHETNLYR